MWPHWGDERLGCVFVGGWWMGGRYRLIYTLPPTFTITRVTHTKCHKLSSFNYKRMVRNESRSGQMCGAD